MKVTLDMPDLPEGYRYTGQYRELDEGDLCFDSGKIWECDDTDPTIPYPIVVKTRWRANFGGTFYFISPVGMVVCGGIRCCI